MADYSILLSAYFSRKRWFTAVAETTRPASMLESPSLSFWRNSSTEETVTLAGAGSFPPFVVLKITYSDLCKKQFARCCSPRDKQDGLSRQFYGSKNRPDFLLAVPAFQFRYQNRFVQCPVLKNLFASMFFYPEAANKDNLPKPRQTKSSSSIGLDKFVLHAFSRVQSVNSALKMFHIAF